MLENKSIKKIILFSLTSAVLVASQSNFAHTRFKTPVINENGRNHGSDYNAEVIGHTCKTDAGVALDALATVVLFPDGVDSTLTVDGVASDLKVIDFVTNWGSPVQSISNKDVFGYQDEITTPLGNTVGYWMGGGPGLQHNLAGILPFRTSGVIIDSESCAKSVTFRTNIADICEITKASEFSTNALNIWSVAVEGSKFQIPGSKGDDSPATLKVLRTSVMPATCGEGVDVVVTPTAAQINRDMPIIYNGKQLWPKPE
ncbi:MAG: hypothetical protein HOE45_09205 [Gammaproteobacteria bacterium]|nr:hypothetical protein [Gammaproteobacteria bacterium]